MPHSKWSIVSWRYAFRDNRFTLLNCILIFPSMMDGNTAYNCTAEPHSTIYTAQLLQMACSNNCLAFSNIVRPMNNLVLVLVHVHLVLLLLSCEWFACISINVHFIYAFQFSIISNPSLVISSSDRSALHILPTYRLYKSWQRLQSFSHWANNYSDRQKHSAFASKQWLLSSSSFYGALFLLLGMLVLSDFAI